MYKINKKQKKLNGINMAEYVNRLVLAFQKKLSVKEAKSILKNHQLPL